MQDYAIYRHFLDIKQAYITGMFKALQEYDLSHNVPFVVFKEYAAMREMHDYIRTMRGMTVQNSDEYLRLRNMPTRTAKKAERKLLLTALPIQKNCSSELKEPSRQWQRLKVLTTVNGELVSAHLGFCMECYATHYYDQR